MEQAVNDAPGCPICGAGGLHAVQRLAEPAAGGRSYTLLLCSSCGVQHWDPLVHPGASFYEDEQVMIYRALHDGKARRDDPRFDRFFATYPDLRGIRALDVGCSDGAFLARLETKGNEVWGIDIDERALAVARGRGLSNTTRAEVGDFVAKARRDGLRFHLVTAFDVIEHLTDPLGAVRELASVLEPGGRLVGTVPNRRRRFANAMPIDFPPHHFFRFDAASMRSTLERAGLATESVDSFQFNYAAATVLASVLRPFRKQRQGPPVPPSPTSSRERSASVLARARRVALRGFDLVSTPLSFALERPGSRGFKLFFAARKRA